MAKQRIRLTESQLHNIVRRCVNEAVNELDWKTYANAAKKRYEQSKTDQSKWENYYELNKMANKRFDDDFVGDMKFDTMGDKFKGKHSPRFSANFSLNRSDRMPYGAINGYNKNGDRIFSTDKGTYHSSNGRTQPGSFFRDKSVGDAYKTANDELWDYDKGNYDYDNENGWHLKDK